MKAYKRLICFILSLIIVLNLFACGPSDDTSKSDGADSTARGTVSDSDTKPEESEPAETEPPEPAKAPDPDFYLNTAPDSTVDEYRVYSFKGDPTKAAQNYVSVLQNEYKLTLTDSYSDGTTLGWHLQEGSNEEADVDLSVNCTGGINWEMWISFGADIELCAAETWDEPIVPVISAPTLPSPDAFFDHKLARNEDFYSEKDEKHILSFKADIDTGTLAMEEYVSLLNDEKLRLVKVLDEEETILYIQNHHLGFNYTGGEEIADVIDKDSGIAADVLVYVQRNAQKETALLTFYYKPDTFEFVDFGDRTSYSPADRSGKNTSSNVPDIGDNYDSHQECSSCDGSGKCKTCGGDGYLYSSSSGEEDRNCYKCHPNYGKCPDCRGSGKRN